MTSTYGISRTAASAKARLLSLLPLTLAAACAIQKPLPVSQPSPAAPVMTPPSVGVPMTIPSPAMKTEPDDTPLDSPSKVQALRIWIGQQDRLYRVVAPLLLQNTELCTDHVRNLLGLTAKTRYSYTSAFADAAQSSLGLGEQLRVMNVLPGSGAALAGVRPGDILTAVEIEPLPAGPNAEDDASAIIGSEMQGRTSLNLTLLRNDAHMTIEVPLTPACAMAVDIGNTNNVNSYADGHRILVTNGMLNFTRSDDELAYVLAKEIAHNILMSSARADMGQTIDRLRALPPGEAGIETAADIAPYSPVMDATADKLSLYLLARAGYDIQGTPDFWARLAARFPKEIADSHTALHPATAYRMSVMKEIVQVIRMKQEKNMPLVP